MSRESSSSRIIQRATDSTTHGEEHTGRSAAGIPAGYLQFYGLDPNRVESSVAGLPAGYLAHYGIQRKRGEAGGLGGGDSGGSGQRLPEAVQAKFENALGHDFSSVRVHESGGPQSVGALAYTQGTDIHFAPGQYSPGTQRGQELLGHELTHVVQQSEGRVGATTQHKGVAINDDAGLEREADDLGARAARGESVARSGIQSFQGEHSAASIQQGQGRVLGGSVQQHKKDSSGVLQCYPGFGGGDDFKPKTGKKETKIKGETGDWSVNAGLTKVPKDGSSGEYEIEIRLKLNEKAKDSKNVRFVQSVRRGDAGGGWYTKANEPGMNAQRSERAAADGWRVDRADAYEDKTPFYGHKVSDTGDLQAKSNAAPGQFGGADVYLYDAPSVSDPLALEFASNAVDDTSGVSYGSVAWGFKYNSSAKMYEEETPRLLQHGDSRLTGQAAAYKKWNEVYGPGTSHTDIGQVPIPSTGGGKAEMNDGIVPTGDTRVA